VVQTSECSDMLLKNRSLVQTGNDVYWAVKICPLGGVLGNQQPPLFILRSSPDSIRAKDYGSALHISEINVARKLMFGLSVDMQVYRAPLNILSAMGRLMGDQQPPIFLFWDLRNHWYAAIHLQVLGLHIKCCRLGGVWEISSQH